MKVLGIESSCDETAAAVVEDGRRILSNVVASQIEIHRRYGGVVPEVASRQHVLSIVPVVQQALSEAGVSWGNLDGIAATMGPGLAGSLLVGANFAKTLAFARGLPLTGVNHLEAHIYANWLGGDEPVFPSLCLIVSGGHSDLVLMAGHGRYSMLGRTRDDAAGEAFDKAARILGLGYPGGPAIEKASARGTKPHRFTRAWLPGTDDFSFSGLKTAVLHAARAQGITGDAGEPTEAAYDLAAGFQEAVVDMLSAKTAEAARREGVSQVLLAGGVAANRALRQAIVERSPAPVLCPDISLCTDNAAMVASCGYFRLKEAKTAGWDLDVTPNLKLT